MSELIDRLISDHRHITRLLNCLDKEVAGYREGNDHSPKLDVILDALDYLHNYPDSFHHPLESRLIARLRPRITSMEDKEILELIEEQHQQIHGLTTTLLERFQNISTDHVVPISPLLADYQRYADLQREHMKTENLHMIPAMQRLLTSDDLNLVHDALQENPDPLFGAHIWESYEDLYRFVTETVTDPA